MNESESNHLRTTTDLLTFSPDANELLKQLFPEPETLDEQAAKLDSTPGIALGDRWE